MPHRKCCIPKCLSKTGQGLRFFRFATKRRHTWVDAVRIVKGDPRWSPTSRETSICEKHFCPQQWEKIREDGTRSLRFLAVPTLFPGMSEDTFIKLQCKTISEQSRQQYTSSDDPSSVPLQIENMKQSIRKAIAGDVESPIVSCPELSGASYPSSNGTAVLTKTNLSPNLTVRDIKIQDGEVFVSTWSASSESPTKTDCTTDCNPEISSITDLTSDGTAVLTKSDLSPSLTRRDIIVRGRKVFVSHRSASSKSSGKINSHKQPLELLPPSSEERICMHSVFDCIC